MKNPDNLTGNRNLKSHKATFLLYLTYTQTFTFMWPCIVTNFFVIKPTSCTNFPNLLRH